MGGDEPVTKIGGNLSDRSDNALLAENKTSGILDQIVR